RYQPALVDRVAGKSAAEVIIDAALANAGERELHGGAITRGARALPRAPQKLEHHRLREFWRAAHAAVDGVDHAGKLIGSTVEVGCGNRHASLGARVFRQPRHQRAAVLLDALRLLPEHALDLAQEVGEGGLSITRGL